MLGTLLLEKKARFAWHDSVEHSPSAVSDDRSTGGLSFYRSYAEILFAW
jgi:hypothetical protein